jgi:kinesin family member C1
MPMLLFLRTQELRGNVRVFARVRPFLPEDKVKEAQPKPWLRVRADGVSLDVMNAEMTSTGTKMGEDAQYTFEYDKAFDPSQGQEDIFIEVLSFRFSYMLIVLS